MGQLTRMGERRLRGRVPKQAWGEVEPKQRRDAERVIPAAQMRRCEGKRGETWSAVGQVLAHGRCHCDAVRVAAGTCVHTWHIRDPRHVAPPAGPRDALHTLLDRRRAAAAVSLGLPVLPCAARAARDKYTRTRRHLEPVCLCACVPASSRVDTVMALDLSTTTTLEPFRPNGVPKGKIASINAKRGAAGGQWGGRCGCFYA